MRKSGALLEHKALELFDPKLGHQELNACAIAVLLFAEPGKYSRNSLRGGQQFLLRKEGIKQLGLMRHSAEAATDIQFEAPFFDTVLCPFGGDDAHIVHIDKPTGFIFTA